MSGGPEGKKTAAEAVSTSKSSIVLPLPASCLRSFATICLDFISHYGGSELKTKITVIALVAIAAASAGFFFWRSMERDQIARSALTPLPNFQGVNPALVERIRVAQDQIQRGYHPVEALATLARLCYANGWLEPAASLCNALTELEPRNPQWVYLLALIEANRGQLDEALPLLQQTIKLAPEHLPAQLKAANVMVKLNQTEAAIAMEKSVLEKDPSNIYAWVGLGNIYSTQKKWDLAGDSFQKAISISGDFRPAWLGLVSLYEATANARAAAEAQTQVNQVAHDPESPDPWIDSMLEECYNVYYLRVAAHSNPDTNIARRLLERAVRLQPDDGAAQLDLGMLLFQLKAFEKARRSLTLASSLIPTDSNAWLGLINISRATQDSAEMEHAIRIGLSYCPGSAGLWLERGRMLAQARNYDGALAAFAQSAALDTKEAIPHVYSAVAYFQTDRAERALSELKTALAVQPDNPSAQVIMARYAISVGDKEDAFVFVKKAQLNRAVLADEKRQLQAAFEAEFGPSPH